MSFQKRIEDFVCEHCHAVIKGSGYTNHCPKCLWSKHVDVSPGDRKEVCGGMMAPVRIEGATPEYVLVHRCERCGIERRNKLSDSDDMSAVAAIAKRRG
ncbi:RNHCP domain-containing protein [Candidatus Parcubacteria bacterium]|nr:MAG: RNHCP domain-containing protein [Candidatus Parcubacteria bacterium]